MAKDDFAELFIRVMGLQADIFKNGITDFRRKQMFKFIKRLFVSVGVPIKDGDIHRYWYEV